MCPDKVPKKTRRRSFIFALCCRCLIPIQSKGGLCARRLTAEGRRDSACWNKAKPMRNKVLSTPDPCRRAYLCVKEPLRFRVQAGVVQLHQTPDTEALANDSAGRSSPDRSFMPRTSKRAGHGCSASQAQKRRRLEFGKGKGVILRPHSISPTAEAPWRDDCTSGVL